MEGLYQKSNVKQSSSGKGSVISKLLAPQTQSSRSKEYCFGRPFYPQFLVQLQGHGIPVCSQHVVLVHSVKSMESEDIEA